MTRHMQVSLALYALALKVHHSLGRNATVTRTLARRLKNAGYLG